METERVRGSWISHPLQPTLDFNALSRTQSLCSSLGQIRSSTAELPPTDMSHRWNSLSRCNSLPQPSLSSSTISTRRGFTHDLSVPTNLAFRAPQTSELSPAEACPRRTVKDDAGCTLQSICLHANQPLPVEPNMTYYLPTPPEEIDCIDWETAGQQLHGEHHSHAAADVSPGHTPNVPDQSIASLPSNLLQDAYTRTIGAQMLQCPEWLTQACQVLVSKLSIPGADLDNVELVSQILPSQAQDLRSKPTFELIHDLMQQMRSTTVYMTITHAVTQSRVRREFPRSPPATPMRPNEDGYFGNQNVFTNASVVPTYHGSSEPVLLQNPPMIHHVMAPSKANIVVLERYIPPNNAEEISDFFNANSGKSYLADRLPELSRRNGTLLLIYPTKQGGHTFATEYLGPVLDPILRQQAVLHGLNTYAAENIGRLSTVDSMLNFDEMNVRVNHFCERMTEISNQRSPRSAYSVVHGSTGQIVIDHQTWMSWFIEQEQERIKKNLVDYQVRSAGKLSTSSELQLQFSPEGDSRVADEPSVSGLTRDIIDSLRKSVHRSPEVGIEVACFIIRRNDVL